MSVTYADLYGDPPPPRPPSPPKGPTTGPAAVVVAASPPTPEGDRMAILDAFVRRSLPTISPPNALRVWLVLLSIADPKGIGTLSQARIAERLNLSRKTVGRAVRRLRALGVLKVKRQGGFPNRVTTYRVLPGKPARQPLPVAPATARDT